SYHMQHVHGISAATLRPMPPPDHSRKPLKRKLPVNDQSKIHGFCGSCQQWVCVEGETELKVPEIVWWKHARACQLNSLAPKLKPCDKRRVV
ncbi:hypothetical protein CYLTODRAFT_359247, partial [Cylindrobasidium torrendii FP15055 ss-10]